MIFHYCKVVFRTIRSEKLRSLFSITGLAIGLSSSFLLLLYLQYELSYDRALPNRETTFRIDTDYTFQKTPIKSALTFGGLAAELSEQIPEIISAGRIMPMLTPDDIFASVARRNVPIAKPFAVDPEIIDLLSLRFLRGDPATALSGNTGCILNADLAARLFGDLDPLGKTLILQNKHPYTITGIVSGPPGHSHFQFDLLMSVPAMSRLLGWPMEMYDVQWNDMSSWVYVRTQEGADLRQLQKKMNTILAANTPSQRITEKTSVSLQPVTDIYLHSGSRGAIGPSGDIQTITVVSALCLILLIISVLNYLNISVSRSLTRLADVGKRYTLGAQRRDIFMQHTVESVIFAFLALFPAFFFTRIIFPVMNQTLHTGGSLPSITNPSALLLTLVITLLIGIAAGLYPAFFISRVNLAALCRGMPVNTGSKHPVRNNIVIVQLLFTLFFINCTLVVTRQVQFMRTRDLGFNTDGIITLSLNTDTSTDRTRQLKQALVQLPGITSVSASSSLPGSTNSRFLHLLFDDKLLEQPVHFICADEDFLTTYSLKLLSGKFLNSRQERGVQTGFVLNEAAVRMMGWEQPLGHSITKGEESGPVIGVVKNFHFQSLHESIKPLIICPLWNRTNTLSIRLNTGISQQVLGSIETVWKQIYPMQPITIRFLDETIERLYEAEHQTHRLYTASAAIAILLSAIGLFGLSDLQLEQRIPEIGIRKIMGGSLTDIFILLYRQYLVWVVTAAVLAGPPAYLVMRHWLENFAYTASMPGWIYLLSAGLTAVIILLTISRHIVSISLINPVKTLREE